MPNPAIERPSICLNMIVRNEAHIIAETLDAVAPYISSWVIVDTGSTDGTQDLIEKHLTGLAIPGELHERPWRNFGHNRSEALALAQGHADYIWVMDADDMIVGTPNFSQLSADVYQLRYGGGDDVYWRPQLFRSGLRIRYEGVVHEYAAYDDACAYVRMQGDYHIESRRLGARNLDPQKYARDRDLLLAEVERNPEDTRSVFYLAQSLFDLGDIVSAREWYLRRVEMGGWDEEVYFAMYRIAESMMKLDSPWPDVQNAYLRAWEFRPTRAEPLYAIARRYREEQRYQLGHLFAQRAAALPFPETDVLFVRKDIHAWRAIDEQAVCASWIGKHPEAFALWRRLLAHPGLPEEDRQRIAANRDVCVPTMLDAAASYPDVLVHRLAHRASDAPEADVTVSLVIGPDRQMAERTLNSFLNCCTDVWRVRRFLAVDAGLATPDRATLLARYGFLEFARPGAERATGAERAALRAQIDSRFWLHLGAGWRFFAPENYLTRLTAVLEAEPQVFQVGINFADASELTGSCAAEPAVRRAPDAGRYVLTNSVASGPAIFDTARLPQADDLRTASLDEVLAVATV